MSEVRQIEINRDLLNLVTLIACRLWYLRSSSILFVSMYLCRIGGMNKVNDVGWVSYYIYSLPVITVCQLVNICIRIYKEYLCYRPRSSTFTIRSTISWLGLQQDFPCYLCLSCTLISQLDFWEPDETIHLIWKDRQIICIFIILHFTFAKENGR